MKAEFNNCELYCEFTSAPEKPKVWWDLYLALYGSLRISKAGVRIVYIDDISVIELATSMYKWLHSPQRKDCFDYWSIDSEDPVFSIYEENGDWQFSTSYPQEEGFEVRNGLFSQSEILALMKSYIEFVIVYCRNKYAADVSVVFEGDANALHLPITFPPS